jgi:hypothetical protein
LTELESAQWGSLIVGNGSKKDFQATNSLPFNKTILLKDSSHGWLEGYFCSNDFQYKFFKEIQCREDSLYNGELF